MLKYLMITLSFLGLMMPIGHAADKPDKPDKPELVVYTYDSFASEWGPGPQIKAEFEKTCYCTLTFVGLSSSVGVLSRIMFEGAATKADVVLGLDTSLTSIAANTGLFAEHGLETRGRLALPDDIGFWSDKHFLPFDWGYFAFNYDRRRMDKPPTSFAELLDADNDMKIVIQDPRTATPGLGLMLWVNAVYGERAPDAWARLAPKLVTVTKGWWDAYSMFLEGEADMVLSYSTSPAYHLLAEGDDNYAAAEFTDGHYLQVEVAGVVKSSTKPALARLFLQRLMEAEMQSILPTTNWMYPSAKTGVIPDGFDGLITPSKSFLFSPQEVERNRKAWVDAWVNGLSQ